MGQPPHRLQILSDYKGLALCQPPHPLRLTAEIGYQSLHLRLGVLLMNRLDHSRKVPGAMILQIVAINRGQHDIAQVQQPHHVGRILDFGRVEIAAGVARLDITEAAAAGTGVSQDHNRRRTRLPTLRKIGARRLFTNRMQSPLTQAPADLLVILSPLQGHLQPFWFHR